MHDLPAVIALDRHAADGTMRAIQDALREYVGDESPFDDISLVAVKRVGE